MDPHISRKQSAAPSPQTHFSHAAVFGAAQGIGAEIASHLRAHGSQLLLLIDKHPRFPDSEPQDPKRGEHLIRADVSSQEQISKAFNGIAPRSLDLAVLSAGVRSDDTESMRRVNSDGVANSIEILAPLMKKGGLLVLVSSDFFTIAPEDPYAITKRDGAQHASRAAQRHADDFRVLILLPGPVDTTLFTHGKPQDRIERIEATDGILSTKAFSKMLFDEVIPGSRSRPTGSVVAMYKHSGVTWRPGI